MFFLYFIIRLAHYTGQQAQNQINAFSFYFPFLFLVQKTNGLRGFLVTLPSRTLTWHDRRKDGNGIHLGMQVCLIGLQFQTRARAEIVKRRGIVQWSVVRFYPSSPWLRLDWHDLAEDNPRMLFDRWGPSRQFRLRTSVQSKSGLIKWIKDREGV